METEVAAADKPVVERIRSRGSLKVATDIILKRASFVAVHYVTTMVQGDQTKQRPTSRDMH